MHMGPQEVHEVLDMRPLGRIVRIFPGTAYDRHSKKCVSLEVL